MHSTSMFFTIYVYIVYSFFYNTMNRHTQCQKRLEFLLSNRTDAGMHFTYVCSFCTLRYDNNRISVKSGVWSYLFTFIFILHIVHSSMIKFHIRWSCWWIS